VSQRLRILLALVAVVALTGPLAACGIPKDSEPRLIADEPEGFNTSTTPTSDVGGRTVVVYLVDGRLKQPRLSAREHSTPEQPGPIEAVRALLAGVTEEDDAEGYQTKIPQNTELRNDSRIQGKRVTIDLSAEISTIAGAPAVQAYAQLVYTATNYGPDEVLFMTEGKPIKAQTDGETKSVVSRDDYRSLDPQP
jgi:spore germination protein GerM